MQNRRINLAIAIVIALVRFCYPFGDQISHPAITKTATYAAHVDQIAKNKLGFEEGADKILEYMSSEYNRSIRDWIIAGSKDEDIQPKAVHHFHNPLKDISDGNWINAGQSDVPILNLISHSNAHWGTGYVGPSDIPTNHSPTSNNFDWDHAREYYYIYLTGRNYNGTVIASNSTERESFLALCFLALGHTMHLLQDMAVPAHVRNDMQAHVPGYNGTRQSDAFEAYVDEHISLNPPITDLNCQLMAVLTGYWDKNVYDGTNPVSTLDAAIGLSEFTNANFLSKNTIFRPPNDQNHYFPHPWVTSTNCAVAIQQTVSITSEDGVQDNVHYLTKNSQGVTIPHFLSFTYSGLLAPDWCDNPSAAPWKIDNQCFDDYMKILVPKAVGYSANLLKYFFRDSLFFKKVDAQNNIYAFDNKSVYDMYGRFEIYKNEDNGARTMLWSRDNMGIAANAQSENITDFTPPADQGSAKLTVVFKGRFGQENNAVIGTISCGCPDELVDLDGNVYKTILIGNQCWSVENLKTTKYNDGSSLAYVPDKTAWYSSTTGAYCFYDNNTANGVKYGALYNEYAVNTGKLAPDGWHVSNNTDWIKLEEYLVENGYNYDGSIPAGNPPYDWEDNKIAKSMAAQTDWNELTDPWYASSGCIGYDLSANNSSGFSALPGGFRFADGNFDNRPRNGGLWWSLVEDDESSYVSCRILGCSINYLERWSCTRSCGLSVRLVRDSD